MNEVSFRNSVRAKFFTASLILLLIPFAGFLFVRELVSYLRLGQEQVTIASAKLVAASLSDRPALTLRLRRAPESGVEPATLDERAQAIALFSASDTTVAASLGTRYQPDQSVERILNQSIARDARVWVIDIAGNVRGLVGSLQNPNVPSAYEHLLATASRRLASTKSNVTVINAVESKDDVMKQSERALVGEPNTEWRVQLDDRIGVLSVAEPVWQGDNIVGVVVVEQSDLNQRGLTASAAQSVIAVSVLVFLVAFGVLLWFAFGLSRRLTRLQRDANAAVDSQGRITGTIKPTNDTDEIGTLSRTLDAMVTRQAGYNQYLEKLAGRLSHELRTPVAVVRSSLDNLRASTLNEDGKKYLERADEGVSRLSTLISRMSEATQLERMLQGAERERIELGAMIEGCVNGYRLAFPAQAFTFERTSKAVWVMAVPDAIAQMLDKLVQNAVDFAAPNTPIVVRVALGASNMKDMRDQRADSMATLTVENTGALLPAVATSLFESMISHRPGMQNGGHLGLGLYIARLVAEFHQGTIGAENRVDGIGVVFRVDFPITK